MLKNKVPFKITDKNGQEWIFDKRQTNSKFNHQSNRIVYKLNNVDFTGSVSLSVQDIEKRFSKENREPSSLPIKQGYRECAISSMAMLTKKPVDEIRSILKDLGWEVESGVGYYLQKKALRKLGFRSMLHYTPPRQPCIVVLPSLNIQGVGHQVYWDEKEILDPQYNSNQSKWYGPDWGLSEINADYFITVEKLV